MKKHYCLWLDESGDFTNDKNKKWNPSLVGGVLLEKNSVTSSDIDEIIPEKIFHANTIEKKEFGNKILPRIEKMLDKGMIPVIFENSERILVVDGTTTYLNVLAEGVVHLMQFLAAKAGKFDLEVLIATRQDMDNISEKTRIEEEEYKQRIKEKITLGLAKRTITNIRVDNIKINFASATKDKRLMISDLICNCWLTRTSGKFSKEQRIKLESFYMEDYRFSLLEDSTDLTIKRMIAEGDFSSAIMFLYSAEKFDSSKIEPLLFQRLHSLSESDLNAHMKILSIKIVSLFKIDKDYKTSKGLLKKLQDRFLVKLRDGNEKYALFAFDIAFQLLTIFTHEGDLESAERQKKICDDEFSKTNQNLESIQLWFSYKNRLAVNYTNYFDFYATIREEDEHISVLEETKDLFSMIDGLSKVTGNLKNEALGKAYGTRLYAKTFLIRQQPEFYAQALEDSDKAIKEFAKKDDLGRQYLYRSKIECEKGEFQKALMCLYQAVDINDEALKCPEEFISAIEPLKEGQLSFSLMHYIRLMAQSTIDKEIEFSDTLFEALNKSSFDLNLFSKENHKDHPYEVINWKLGTYHAVNEHWKAANDYYKKAVEICFFSKEKKTLNVIGLAILAEKISLFSVKPNNNKIIKAAVKKMKKEYQNFSKQELPESISVLVDELELLIGQAYEEKVGYEKYKKEFWGFSRKICY